MAITHKIFCVKPEEVKEEDCCTSWDFICKNKDRCLSNYSDVLQENTVDPSYLTDSQRIVLKGVVYYIKKDYLNLDGNERIFVLVPRNGRYA